MKNEIHTILLEPTRIATAANREKAALIIVSKRKFVQNECIFCTYTVIKFVRYERNT